jgi:hypothetical protein
LFECGLYVLVRPSEVFFHILLEALRWSTTGAQQRVKIGYGGAEKRLAMNGALGIPRGLDIASAAEVEAVDMAGSAETSMSMIVCGRRPRTVRAVAHRRATTT